MALGTPSFIWCGFANGMIGFMLTSKWFSASANHANWPTIDQYALLHLKDCVYFNRAIERKGFNPNCSSGMGACIGTKDFHK